MSWYPACSGSEDGPGANFNPPTMGSFFRQNSVNNKRLREARAEATVIHEARAFHERQARKYGVDTNRGIAHFRASKMYAKEGKLQEMFGQQQQGDGGTELGELPPKAIMKAHSAAAKFHKKQAEKAGLDSDLGHAHVAAMENHMDTFKKAKAAHQASKQPGKAMQPPPQPGAMAASKREATEGGPGSGRHKGIDGAFKKAIGRAKEIGKDKIAAKLQQIQKDGNKNGYTEKHADRVSSLHDQHASGFGRDKQLLRHLGHLDSAIDEHQMDQSWKDRAKNEEAFGGHGSKQSPVPVPQKKDQPNGDIKQNKPPVAVHPADANKPGMDGGMTRLQQNETMGAHAGMIKASNRSEAIERFGREAHNGRGPDMGMDCTEPSSVKKQMKPDTVFRGKRLKMKSGTAAAGEEDGPEYRESRRRRYL